MVEEIVSPPASPLQTPHESPDQEPGIMHEGVAVPIFAPNNYRGRANPAAVLRCYATLVYKAKSLEPRP